MVRGMIFTQNAGWKPQGPVSDCKGSAKLLWETFVRLSHRFGSSLMQANALIVEVVLVIL
jgi:hypothetical protein